MRNNTRGLLFHILVTACMFVLASMINMNETVLSILYGNKILRILFAIVPIILYFNFARAMSKKTSSRLDFFAGNLIVLICLILAAVSMVGMSASENREVAGTLWRLPLDMFMFTEVYVMELIGIKASVLNICISSIVPTIIYGISIKKSRVRIKRNLRRRR